MIKSGRPIMVGPGDNRRSMSYVDNIVQGALLARDVPSAAGETYFIADRTPYTFLEILETVGRLLEVPIKPRRLPRLAGSSAQLVDACMQAVGLYKQEVHVAGELGESIAVSIEKAERELGYAPEVELEEGMRRSIAWCRERGIDI
jgi:nucleoside-diphosphate-sugar epimerase